MTHMKHKKDAVSWNGYYHIIKNSDGYDTEYKPLIEDYFKESKKGKGKRKGHGEKSKGKHSKKKKGKGKGKGGKSKSSKSGKHGDKYESLVPCPPSKPHYGPPTYNIGTKPYPSYPTHTPKPYPNYSPPNSYTPKPYPSYPPPNSYTPKPYPSYPTHTPKPYPSYPPPNSYTPKPYPSSPPPESYTPKPYPSYPPPNSYTPKPYPIPKPPTKPPNSYTKPTTGYNTKSPTGYTNPPYSGNIPEKVPPMTPSPTTNFKVPVSAAHGPAINPNNHSTTSGPTDIVTSEPTISPIGYYESPVANVETSPQKVPVTSAVLGTVTVVLLMSMAFMLLFWRRKKKAMAKLSLDEIDEFEEIHKSGIANITTDITTDEHDGTTFEATFDNEEGGTNFGNISEIDNSMLDCEKNDTTLNESNLSCMPLFAEKKASDDCSSSLSYSTQDMNIQEKISFESCPEDEKKCDCPSVLVL